MSAIPRLGSLTPTPNTVRFSVSGLRDLAAVAVLELPRYAWALAQPSDIWLFLRNRYERVECDLLTGAPVCDWQWSSELHAPKLVPSIGRLLLRRALQHDAPHFSSAPVAKDLPPSGSFIIGHRGHERLPLLLATLESIAGQSVPVECIVVEQSLNPTSSRHLPSWVRYIHIERDDALPYNRSLAFNRGAQLATSEMLVFHDNDLLVSPHYTSSLRAACGYGHPAVSVKRFIFYLSHAGTTQVLSERTLDWRAAPESIVQNAEAGGSIAVQREAFWSLGGFDERFQGWGGEDIEFWDRASSCGRLSIGTTCLFHLWHAAQVEKNPERSSAGMEEYRRLSQVAPARRIVDLRAFRERMAARERHGQPEVQ